MNTGIKQRNVCNFKLFLVLVILLFPIMQKMQGSVYTTGFIWDLAADFDNPVDTDVPISAQSMDSINNIVWSYGYFPNVVSTATFGNRNDTTQISMLPQSVDNVTSGYYKSAYDTESFYSRVSDTSYTTASADISVGPRTDRPIVIVWQAPVNATVDISGYLAKANFGSLKWTIDKVSGNTQTNDIVYGSADTDTNPDNGGGDISLTGLSVNAGDKLVLIIYQNAFTGSVGTSPRLDFTITATNVIETPVNRGAFPLGVYWPWGLTQSHADLAGLSKWEYADRLMGILHYKHVNFIWLTGMSSGELPVFCNYALRHDLTVISGVEARYSLTDYTPSSIDTRASVLTDAWGNCEALVGYLGFDEPTHDELPINKMMDMAFYSYDPSRQFMVVVRPHEAAMAMELLTCKSVAVDPYHYYFNGLSWRTVNDSTTTQQRYIRDINLAAQLARKFGKDCWAVPQSFMQVTGYGGNPGVYYDPSLKKEVVVPGAYAVWRMPSVAEIKWQIWTSLRLGARGIISFVLLPPTGYLMDKDDYIAQFGSSVNPPHPSSNITILTQTEQATGLMIAGLEPSSQLDALSTCYAKLLPLADTLKSFLPSYPLIWSNETSFALSTMEDDAGHYYAVVVNNNLASSVTANISLMPCIQQVNVLTNYNQSLPIVNGMCELTIGAGEGVVLKLETPANSHGLFKEVDYTLLQLGTSVGTLYNGLQVPRCEKIPSTESGLTKDNTEDSAWIEYPLSGKLAPDAVPGKMFLVFDATQLVTADEGQWGAPGASLNVSFADANLVYSDPVSVSSGTPIEIPRTTKRIRIELTTDLVLNRMRVIYCASGN